MLTIKTKKLDVYEVPGVGRFEVVETWRGFMRMHDIKTGAVMYAYEPEGLSLFAPVFGQCGDLKVISAEPDLLESLCVKKPDPVGEFCAFLCAAADDGLLERFAELRDFPEELREEVEKLIK